MKPIYPTVSDMIASGSILSESSTIESWSGWFARCIRWARLEEEDDFEVDAWLALKQIESIDKRMKWKNVLIGYLNACNTVYLEEN